VIASNVIFAKDPRVATFTPLNNGDVRQLLSDYQINDFIAFYGIKAGSVNSNFAVETASGRFFLRVYEEQDVQGAQTETRMLTVLAAGGVHTPAPVARRDRAFVSQVRGKAAALFPWQDGRMRCQASVTALDAERVGAALAGVHVVGERAERQEGRFREADLLGRLDRIAAATDPVLAAHTGPLRNALTRWCRARDAGLPRGLIHGDLFRDNVLWNDAAEIAALLDFESASDGVLAYDLMVTILAWCVGDDLDLELAQAMARGYQSVRRLTDAEKRGLVAEGCIAALRFSITRITDYAMRAGVGPRDMKDYRRFLMRLTTLERIAENAGQEGIALALDL